MRRVSTIGLALVLSAGFAVPGRAVPDVADADPAPDAVIGTVEIRIRDIFDPTGG